MTQGTLNPFRVSFKPRWLAKLVNVALGLPSLAHHYDRRPFDASPEQFLDYTLQALNIGVHTDGVPLAEALPETGATLVVANHPFGGIEGVALTRALMSHRPDTKVLTNQMLASISELAPAFLGVDVLSSNAAHRNTAGIRAAMAHLKSGGCLLLFPAGQVSAMSWRRWSVEDRQWHQLAGRLAQKTQATCVPVYIHGHNPLYFQLGGLIHRRIRTALLPRQLANKTGKTLRMTVGGALLPRDYKNLNSATAITDMLRVSTYLLANSQQQSNHLTFDAEELSAPQIDAAILDELNQLSPYLLLSKGSFDVYCAPFSQLKLLFPVIARARERTFRAAGEGTGKDYDIDQFDPHYLHLFVWDREAKAIVGGYRLGETDRIIQQHGIEGLYSRSLYQYDLNYLHRLGPALEVGRSFVTAAYQRHPSALDLLWRGIGHFAVKHPQYCTLFGCVSVSSELSTLAQAFISDAMMENFRAEQKFLTDVKPLVPLRVKGKLWSRSMLASIQDIGVFNKLVGLCDPGKTIPVLLRHYLALNGRFAGFTVNRQFNDSLDGLIIVDLRQIPERYRTRYLGQAGNRTYMEYWNQHEQP